MKKWSKWSIFRITWLILVLILFAWNWSTFQSRDLPENTFSNSAILTVTETKDLITFQADIPEEKLDVIFFQGGMTDPKAYAPLCRKLAESGYTCHLVKMAWRLPQFDYQKVSGLFELEKGNYVIGGHSQGGKVAAQFVYENPGMFKGLFLMGTSHPRDIDLSDRKIPCIKIYAENDGLASTEEVMENKNKLPANAKLIFIKGGNHSQFGYLGKLLMDNAAGISLEEQQQKTCKNLVDFLNKVKSGL